MTNRLGEFVTRFGLLLDAGADESRIFVEGAALLSDLVRHDDWLPADCARARPGTYSQYLLHLDPRERFCVVSFVWDAGVRTPIHDHTVWGMVGVMRGAEICHEYDPPAAGAPMVEKAQHRLSPGEIDKVSPRVGDVHVVENALSDQPSVSIHVYGANIGTVTRHVFDPSSGAARTFVSGYNNA